MTPASLPQGWTHLCLADLHVHTGSAGGQPVKITASRALTVRAALSEAHARKGLAVVGLVDAISLLVERELADMVNQGELQMVPGGGLHWSPEAEAGGGSGGLLVIPGAEIELLLGDSPVHFLALLPDVDAVARVRESMGGSQRNQDLGCQRAHGLTPGELRGIVAEAGGILGLAHAFTPHRGFYGSLGQTWQAVFGQTPAGGLDFVEMGLSADTQLADRLEELHRLPLVANSDAHSVQAIGREANSLRCAGGQVLSFAELALALRQHNGRSIEASYGFDPRLGKYYRRVCERCGWQAADNGPELVCPRCGPGKHLTAGVLDRVLGLSAADAVREPGQIQHRSPPHRPPYIHQVPLMMLPGIGARTCHKLLVAFGSEIAVLHQAPLDQIVQVAGIRVAGVVSAARDGSLHIDPGGGGRMGRASLAD